MRFVRRDGSSAEQIVDIFVRNFGERRFEVDAHLSLVLDLSHDVLEDFRELVRRAAHAQPDEAKARPLVEDDDENDPLPYDRDVDVVVLALVGKDRKLLLADQACEAIGRSDVAGRQARETGGVDLSNLSVTGDLLTVLVDEEDQLGVRVGAQAADDRLDLLILLVIHHHGTIHGAAPLLVGRF